MYRRTFLLGCGSLPLAGAVGPTPAAPQSSAYALSASPEGDVFLVWIEAQGDRHALRVSGLEGDMWTSARTISTGGGEWFVNWADHPAVAAGPGGRLMVSWPYRPEGAKGSKWGLATRVMFSPDRGRTWRKVCDLGSDNTADYTGFIGFSSDEKGFGAAYLSPLVDGAHQHDEGHVKTLRFADFSLDGKLVRDELLDPDVCPCCPLATAQASTGPVVVYRDHEEGEVRDISVVRRLGGKWTDPKPVHRDAWQINGCPTNGAAVQAEGESVGVAWFTAAGGVGRVKLALSGDGGASFGSPVILDEGSPVGWTAAAMLGGGRIAVAWVERRPGESELGDLKLKIVDRNGRPGPARTIATASSGRSTGVPQMVHTGGRLVIAWRQDERVRTTFVQAG